MSFVKCYDVVEMVVEDANEQFGVMWRVNREKETLLKKNCSIIDNIANEFGGVSFEVNINDITMDITVSLVCSDMIVENNRHKFYSLINNTKGFSFTKAEDGDNLQVNFVFPGIWEKYY